LRHLAWSGGDTAAALRASFQLDLAERSGFQWLAVAFCAGAAAYLALPREPLLAALLPAALIVSSAALILRHRGRAAPILAVLALLFAGATAAKLRVDRLDQPHIESPFAASFTGRVVSVEDRVELRPRVVVDSLTTDASWDPALPRRIRLTVAERHGLPPLGTRISFRARAMPVPGPVVPGGYDPRRAAYFDGIGGSGFMLGGWTIAAADPYLDTGLAIERVRAAISARIIAVVPGEPGAVAAALLVGERSGISDATEESLRRSGLAHILSISGLHMMLVAGTVFFVVRILLALSPPLALSHPIRKWAAAGALLSATAYLSLSGGNVATIRAYVMAAVMFVAMLVDRPAISMRNLGIAAFIVVALQPEGVLEPGFQMSFSAVVALVATWEAWRERTVRRLGDDGAYPGQRIVHFATRAVFAAGMTTLVAGLATAPFAAFHFERVASYSLLGNLLAAPLVSLVIMPSGVLALFLMPLGFEALPLAAMGKGIEALLAVSGWVAGLPGSEVRAPPIAPAAILLIVAGMLWLCLWRQRWRLLGLPFIGLGLCLIPFLVDRPDVMVAPDGRAIAVRDAAGVLRVSGSRAGSYAVDQFFDKEAGEAPLEGELRKGVRCDPSGCILTAAAGTVVSHALDPAAFPEDCERADLVVTPLVAPAACAASLVIDARRLRRYGAQAVRIEGLGGERRFATATERLESPRPWQAGWTNAPD
jgi:competence protein ComEC